MTSLQNNPLTIGDPIERFGSFLTSLLLVVVTVIVYGQVLFFDFVNYDDPYLIYRNPAVGSGLSLRGLLWASSTTFYEYWHPVTWLSHMLDWELFGPRAGLHHLVSLVFHAANTLLLFKVLRLMTGSFARSALVAGLFALHPLHVESVAWLSERKDLLSAFFWLLTIWAYVRYTMEPETDAADRRRFYRMALIFLALGLMSKPMLVTTPFVLLLLDLWPLGRLGLLRPKNFDSSNAETRIVPIKRLLSEKLPFFALVLISSVITYLGVRAANNLVSSEAFPWSLRLANTPISYVRYLWKTISPANLAVFYPMPAQWELWSVIAAAVVLAGVSLFAVLRTRTAPYLLVGWLIFLGILVPTIGLVSVGWQSIADRYTYIPLIGVFVALVWGGAEVLIRWRVPTRYVLAGSASLLLACAVLSWFQVRHWRNSFTLWNHCVAVTRDNPVAHFGWGWALQESGRGAEAIEHYREALRIKPDHLNANHNLGLALSELGQYTEATNYFGKALRISPNYAEANIGMGHALYQLKEFSEAGNHYARALQSVSNHVPTLRAYALALLGSGRFEDAVAQSDRALRLDPEDAWSHFSKGRGFSALGLSEASVDCYKAALAINPEFAETHYRLGLEWKKQGQLDRAASSFAEALHIQPSSHAVHLEIAELLERQKKFGDSLAHYREALRLHPESPIILNRLAWSLATCPEANLRNGTEAIQLAERACKDTADKEPAYVGTLAAAYAEMGQFDKAVALAQKAFHAAVAAGQTNLSARQQEMLKRFTDRQPYHEKE
jgi:tetratricopeptide (TPR) repeat protein